MEVGSGSSGPAPPTGAPPPAPSGQPATPVLTPGAVVDVRVLRAVAAGRFLLALGNSEFVADSEAELKPGTQVRLTVAQASPEGVILRLAQPVRSELSAAPQRLAALRLPATPAAAAVLAAFEEAGAPLDPQRLQTALRAATLPGAPAQTAQAHALLARSGLPWTPALVGVALRAAENRLPDVVSTMAGAKSGAPGQRSDAPARAALPISLPDPTTGPPAIRAAFALAGVRPAAPVPEPAQPSPGPRASARADPASPALAVRILASAAPPTEPSRANLPSVAARPPLAQAAARAAMPATVDEPAQPRPQPTPSLGATSSSSSQAPTGKPEPVAPRTATQLPAPLPATPPTPSDRPQVVAPRTATQQPATTPNAPPMPGNGPQVVVPKTATQQHVANPSAPPMPGSIPPPVVPKTATQQQAANPGAPPMPSDEPELVAPRPGVPTRPLGMTSPTPERARSLGATSSSSSQAQPQSVPARPGTILPAAVTPDAPRAAAALPTEPQQLQLLQTVSLLRQVVRLATAEAEAPARPTVLPAPAEPSTTPARTMAAPLATPLAPPASASPPLPAPAHAEVQAAQAPVPSPFDDTVTRTVREHLAEQVFKPKELNDYDRVVPLPLGNPQATTPARMAVATRTTGGGSKATFVRVDAELSHLGPVSVRLSGADVGGPLAITLIAGAATSQALAEELPALVADLRNLGVEAAVRVVSDG